MNSLRLICCAAALAGVGLYGTPGAQAAQLITNGSFANTSGTFTNNTGIGGDDLAPGSTVIPGWTTTGPQHVLWIEPGNAYGLTASPGNASGYFVDLTGQSDSNPYGGLTQTISTVAGDRYALSFDLGSSSVYGGPDGVIASAGATSQTFVVPYVGGSNDDWQTETLDFVATGASTVITLEGSPASNTQYIGVDNVSVTGTSGAVPEPASWVIMLTGSFGMGVVLRRRKRSPFAPAA